MADEKKPTALKIPRVFGGKVIRPFRTSKHNPIFTKKYADERQKNQAKNKPVKRLPVEPVIADPVKEVPVTEPASISEHEEIITSLE
jgi:hypothetical protein